MVGATVLVNPMPYTTAQSKTRVQTSQGTGIMRVLNIRSIFLRILGQGVDDGPVVDQETVEWLGLCESPALVSDCKLERSLLNSICSPAPSLER